MKSYTTYQIVVKNNKTNSTNYLGCYVDFRVANKMRDTMSERMKEDKLDYNVYLHITTTYIFSEEDKKALGL